MKRRPGARKMRPFGQRFQMVYRFPSLDLDDAQQLATAIRGLKHDVGIYRGRPDRHRHGLLRARIDSRLELAFELHLQQADYAVVLELLADRPHQDRAHQTPPNDWIST